MEYRPSREPQWRATFTDPVSLPSNEHTAMMSRKLAIYVAAIISLALYGGFYVGIVTRGSSRAPGAGGYFHYREVPHDWQAYLFIPAAFAESWAIRIYPQPFLTQRSWAEVPQRLILRSPGHNFGFHASQKQFSED